MSKSNMTPNSAARIQSHADRSGRNQGFKSRAQSAGSRNSGKSGGGKSSGGSSKK